MSQIRKLAPAMSFAALGALIFAGISTAAQNAEQAHIAPQPAIVDYDGFQSLIDEVGAVRQARLVSLDEFLRLAQSDNAMILDTRSALDYAFGHIDGAVNLPFSEFTDEKLAKVIGDKQRPILIYCNNNFEDDIEPVVLKRATLALNIPTFINLYGYGYQNIFELEELIAIEDPRIRWVAATPIEDRQNTTLEEGQL